MCLVFVFVSFFAGCNFMNKGRVNFQHHKNQLDNSGDTASCQHYPRHSQHAILFWLGCVDERYDEQSVNHRNGSMLLHAAVISMHTVFDVPLCWHSFVCCLN